MGKETPPEDVGYGYLKIYTPEEKARLSPKVGATDEMWMLAGGGWEQVKPGTFDGAFQYRRRIEPEPSYRILEENEKAVTGDRVFIFKNESLPDGWHDWRDNWNVYSVGKQVELDSRRRAFARRKIETATPGVMHLHELTKENEELKAAIKRQNLRLEGQREAIVEYQKTLRVIGDLACMPANVHTRESVEAGVRSLKQCHSTQAESIKVLHKREDELKAEVARLKSLNNETDMVNTVVEAQRNDARAERDNLREAILDIGETIHGDTATNTSPDAVRHAVQKLVEERDALKVEYESRAVWIEEMNGILGYNNEDGFHSEPSPHVIAQRLVEREKQYAKKLYPALSFNDQVRNWGKTDAINLAIDCLIAERDNWMTRASQYVTDEQTYGGTHKELAEDLKNVQTDLDAMTIQSNLFCKERKNAYDELMRISDILPSYYGEEGATIAERASWFKAEHKKLTDALDNILPVYPSVMTLEMRARAAVDELHACKLKATTAMARDLTTASVYQIPCHLYNRPVGHITNLAGELRKWKKARDAKDLDSLPLEMAGAYLEEYRRLVAFLSTRGAK